MSVLIKKLQFSLQGSLISKAVIRQTVVSVLIPEEHHI